MLIEMHASVHAALQGRLILWRPLVTPMACYKDIDWRNFLSVPISIDRGGQTLSATTADFKANAKGDADRYDVNRRQC